MRYIPFATTATGILGGVLLSWFALSVDALLNAVYYLVVLPLAFYLLLTVVGTACAFRVLGVHVGSVLYSIFMTLNLAGIDLASRRKQSNAPQQTDRKRRQYSRHHQGMHVLHDERQEPLILAP